MRHRNPYLCFEGVRTVIKTALIAHVLIILLWILMTGIDGFCKYDAVPPSSFNAVSHGFFWLAVDCAVVFVGLLSVTNNDERANLKNYPSMIEFWRLCVVVALIANCVHLTATILELVECQTTLCVSFHGILITFTGLLSLLVLLEIVEFYYSFLYLKRLKILKKKV